MSKSVFTDAYRHLLLPLTDARRSSRLSQEVVAKRLKKPQSYVSKYESGERRLDVVELVKVADAIGVDVIPSCAKTRPDDVFGPAIITKSRAMWIFGVTSPPGTATSELVSIAAKASTMCLKKRLLGRSRPLTFRRGLDAMVIENAFYGVSVNGDPEIVQSIPDPGVSPRLVLVRHFYGKIGNSFRASVVAQGLSWQTRRIFWQRGS